MASILNSKRSDKLRLIDFYYYSLTGKQWSPLRGRSGQDVLIGRQRDEEGKWHEPQEQSEVRHHLRSEGGSNLIKPSWAHVAPATFALINVNWVSRHGKFRVNILHKCISYCVKDLKYKAVRSDNNINFAKGFSTCT